MLFGDTIPYARYVSPTEVVEATGADFPDSPGWRLDDQLMRSRGFYPVMFAEEPPEPEDGFAIEATGFELHYSPSVCVGPVMRRVDQTVDDPMRGRVTESWLEPRDIEIRADTSWIEVTDFDYVPIEEDDDDDNDVG